MSGLSRCPAAVVGAAACQAHHTGHSGTRVGFCARERAERGESAYCSGASTIECHCNRLLTINSNRQAKANRLHGPRPLRAHEVNCSRLIKVKATASLPAINVNTVRIKPELCGREFPGFARL